MKKRYRIDRQRAARQFRKEAQSSTEDIPFALPLPEVLEQGARVGCLDGRDRPGEDTNQLGAGTLRRQPLLYCSRW